MRLVVGTLAVLLSTSLAFAGDAAPVRVESVETQLEDASARARAKVAVRVVRILRETNQALLFDRTAGGTYLLVAVGEKVAGYTVEAIDEDEVTLSVNDRQIVLAAPDQSWRRRRGGRGDDARDARDAARPVRGEPAPVAAPADPYGAVADEKAPVDPYGKPENTAPVDPYGRPESKAPADPYADEIREVKAPAAETVRSTSAAGSGGPVGVPVVTVIAPSTPSPAMIGPSPAVTSPSMTPPSPSVTTPSVTLPSMTPPSPSVIGPSPSVIGPSPSVPAIAPASPAPAMIGPSPSPAADPVLARREVDAALADFGALAGAFNASFTPTGVKIDSILGGSLFAKAGLRAGDVIASVDGRPLRSLDDVAALYARAQTLRVVTAQVVRGGKPLALRVTIQ